MNKSDLEKELWSLANGVTAFAALQALAFAYAMMQQEGSARQFHKPFQLFVIILAALIFNGAYILAVCFLCKEGKRLNAENAITWSKITTGRAITIALFALVPLVSVLWPLFQSGDTVSTSINYSIERLEGSKLKSFRSFPVPKSYWSGPRMTKQWLLSLTTPGV